MLNSLSFQSCLGLFGLADIQTHLDRVNAWRFKDVINLFESETCCLGEDEVCEDKLDCVVGDKDDPDLVANLVDSDRDSVVVDCSGNTLHPIRKLVDKILEKTQ